MSGEYLTINEVCQLLDISRPTLDSYRRKSGIEETKIKGRILFRKLDVVEQFCFPERSVKPESELLLLTDSAVEDLEVAPGIFDFRRIKRIDTFGAICLLCCLRGRTRSKTHIYLLVGLNSASFYLKSIHFFQELMRVDGEYVHYDPDVLRDVEAGDSRIIVPLHLVGYKGGEKGILPDIYASLRNQGFSEDLCSSLGWTLGELADNATTHANGPCYFMLSSLVAPYKFLTLTIGDIGVGIPVTIKKKKEYEKVDDFKAFINAFKSNVSSWEDYHQRGKGLNDLLGVAKGNGAWVRAESNGMGVLFDFGNDDDDICAKNAGTKGAGTRYIMVLKDTQFTHVTKKEIDALLDDFMERL